MKVEKEGNILHGKYTMEVIVMEAMKIDLCLFRSIRILNNEVSYFLSLTVGVKKVLFRKGLTICIFIHFVRLPISNSDLFKNNT